MKSILILLLFGLIFSYDRQGACNYAYKYCDKFNPDFNKYSENVEESTNFLSQCLSVGGGQDFEGCEGKDDKGMFKNIDDLKNCLISKGWKKTDTIKKGNAAFQKIRDRAVIVSNDFTFLGNFHLSSHGPKRCSARMFHKFVEFYEPPN